VWAGVKREVANKNKTRAMEVETPVNKEIDRVKQSAYHLG
jgi:hypothetical protein